MSTILFVLKTKSEIRMEQKKKLMLIDLKHGLFLLFRKSGLTVTPNVH